MLHIIGFRSKAPVPMKFVNAAVQKTLHVTTDVDVKSREIQER